jgi:hypothetical protein
MGQAELNRQNKTVRIGLPGKSLLRKGLPRRGLLGQGCPYMVARRGCQDRPDKI